MPNTHPQQLSDRERQVEALRLRTRGKGWQAIADELGFHDRSSAYRSVKSLINRVETESVEEWREVIGARYELLLEKALAELDEADAKGGLVGKSQMLTTARGIVDSQVRLLGVAVNQKLELSGEVKVGNKDLDAAIDRAIEILSRGAVTEGEFPQVGTEPKSPAPSDPVSDPETRRSPNAHEPGCVLPDVHLGNCQTQFRVDCPAVHCIMEDGHRGQHSDGTEVWG